MKKLRYFMNTIADKTDIGSIPREVTPKEVRTLVKLLRVVLIQRDTVHNGLWSKQFKDQINHVLETSNDQSLPPLPDESFTKKQKWPSKGVSW